MARQATQPVKFNRTTRKDDVVGMTSGRAGLSLPITHIPLLRGDSMSGRFMAKVDLAEMPKPLLNAVMVNAQAWFVPKSAHPQFSGMDEFRHSYQGKQINALGEAARNAPAFYQQFAAGADLTAYKGSTFLQTLGIHLENAETLGHNSDLVDAYNLIWNFRAAAHSSRITRRDYVTENAANALALAPAFWPTGKFSHIVPDYERALIVGNLDLDVAQGQVVLDNFAMPNSGNSYASRTLRGHDGQDVTGVFDIGGNLRVREDPDNAGYPLLEGTLAGQTISATIADIDKARTTQAFAKLRTAYAGNDATGFDNDDAIVADLMQGYRVDEDDFKRPWLLDSKRVTFGMNERHATDAANLDDSVTKGMAIVDLSLNVPQQEVGGIVMITLEILPEQLHERQGDPALIIDDVSELPDALRDVQRIEPVDTVQNWRIDNRHSSHTALYGYEPMNAKWDREFTRLGGKFYQANPASPFKEARAGIWTTNIVDPSFNNDHFIAPSPFPHDVFSDVNGDAVEISFQHSVRIRGLTQIGDVLEENNDDYDEVANA